MSGPRSMTGYGRGTRTTDLVGVTVELRAVNHRFLDVQLKLPRAWMALESRLAGAIRGRLGRGRVEAFVRREATGASSRVEADLAVATGIVEAGRALAEALGVAPDPPTVPQLLTMPGVLVSREVDVDADAEASVVLDALETALDGLCVMRDAEGARMVADVASHLDRVEQLSAEIGELARGVPSLARQRIERRAAELLEGTGVELDPERLTQEAAVLADKAAIDEELARLASHLEQARGLLGLSEPVGRRLEFLVQELGRETNTVGSKSSESSISARVVELKSTLEKIREQVANIE